MWIYKNQQLRSGLPQSKGLNRRPGNSFYASRIFQRALTIGWVLPHHFSWETRRFLAWMKIRWLKFKIYFHLKINFQIDSHRNFAI